MNIIDIIDSSSSINSIFNDINVCNDPTHYIKREYSRFHRLGSIQEDGRSLSNSGIKHTVIFAIKQNIKSINYRNHLSRDEVSKIGTNPTNANEVLRILSSIEGLEILSSTVGNEYITCRGDVHLFETLFQSKFIKFTYKGESALRMKEYSLPKCLSDLVGGVLNVVDLPFDFEKSSRAKTLTPTTSNSNTQSYVLYHSYAAAGCIGTKVATVGYVQGACIDAGTTSDSDIYTCSNNIPYDSIYTGSATCTGTPSPVPLPTTCSR